MNRVFQKGVSTSFRHKMSYYICPITEDVIDLEHILRDKLEEIKLEVEYLGSIIFSFRWRCEEMEEFLLAEGY